MVIPNSLQHMMVATVDLHKSFPSRQGMVWSYVLHYNEASLNLGTITWYSVTQSGGNRCSQWEYRNWALGYALIRNVICQIEPRMPATTMQMEHTVKKCAYIQNPLTSKNHSVKGQNLYVIVCCLYCIHQILPLCMRASCKTQKIV